MSATKIGSGRVRYQKAVAPDQRNLLQLPKAAKLSSAYSDVLSVQQLQQG